MEGLPTIGQGGGEQQRMPTLAEMQRSAALQLAIQSFAGQQSATSDDSLIRRAERIREFLSEG